MSYEWIPELYDPSVNRHRNEYLNNQIRMKREAEERNVVYVILAYWDHGNGEIAGIHRSRETAQQRIDDMSKEGSQPIYGYKIEPHEVAE